MPRQRIMNIYIVKTPVAETCSICLSSSLTTLTLWTFSMQVDGCKLSVNPLVYKNAVQVETPLVTPSSLNGFFSLLFVDTSDVCFVPSKADPHGIFPNILPSNLAGGLVQCPLHPLELTLPIWASHFNLPSQGCSDFTEKAAAIYLPVDPFNPGI